MRRRERPRRWGHERGNPYTPLPSRSVIPRAASEQATHSARRSLKYFLGLAAGAFFGNYEVQRCLRGDVGSTGLRTSGAPGATLPLPRSNRPIKAKMSSKFGNSAMEQPLRALASCPAGFAAGRNILRIVSKLSARARPAAAPPSTSVKHTMPTSDQQRKMRCT